MFRENDQPENADAQQIEQQVLDSNDVARRRLMEYREDPQNCEHMDDAQAEAAAVDRSARIMDHWETKDPLVREKLLERVGREMMTVHEAPPAPLNSKEMAPNELGAHIDRDFQTDFNKSQLREDDPKDALETYLHEYRHVEQHYEIQKSHGFGRESVDPERASALEYNRDHYIEPPKDYTQPGADRLQAAYEGQLVEADANRFASTTANNILERRRGLHDMDLKESLVTSDGDATARHRLAAERGGRQ